MDTTEIKHKTLDDYLTDETKVKCEKCRAEIKTCELAAAEFICPVCGKYNRMPARVRIEKLTDKHSFHELFGDIVSDDPIGFSDYKEKYKDAVLKSGENEGVICGAYERMYHDFSCVLPEGYRKALRLMKGAKKFGRPVVCFVDTQGANCGKGAEERGEGCAIAENLYEISGIKTPIITVMTGEGGSGGALALAVADEVWMLENAYYSVVSPEACASILFKDATKAPEAVEHLKLTAHDLFGFGVVERIFAEPKDFTDKQQVALFMDGLKKDLHRKLKSLEKLESNSLLERRYEKYRKIGSGGREEENKKRSLFHRG